MVARGPREARSAMSYMCVCRVYMLTRMHLCKDAVCTYARI